MSRGQIERAKRLRNHIDRLKRGSRARRSEEGKVVKSKLRSVVRRREIGEESLDAHLPPEFRSRSLRGKLQQRVRLMLNYASQGV